MGKTHDDPQSRNEAILQNMLGEENELLEPVSRNETLLMEILEQSNKLPKITVKDAGKVLCVNDEGEWALGEVSGGVNDVLVPPEIPLNATIEITEV